jgi:hypothetical protein
LKFILLLNELFVAASYNNISTSTKSNAYDVPVQTYEQVESVLFIVAAPMSDMNKTEIYTVIIVTAMVEIDIYFHYGYS